MVGLTFLLFHFDNHGHFFRGTDVLQTRDTLQTEIKRSRPDGWICVALDHGAKAPATRCDYLFNADREHTSSPARVKHDGPPTKLEGDLGFGSL